MILNIYTCTSKHVFGFFYLVYEFSENNNLGLYTRLKILESNENVIFRKKRPTANNFCGIQYQNDVTRETRDKLLSITKSGGKFTHRTNF